MKCALILVAVLACAPAVLGTVLLNDTFDYADQAAMNASWNADGTNTVYMLDTTLGDAVPSYKMPSPAATFYSGRLGKNLGGDYMGSDAEPLVFSFDVYLDPANVGVLWNGARHFVELRGYSGDAYLSGSAQSIVAMGVYNTTNDGTEGTFSNKWYNARVWLAGDWRMLNGAANTPQRATGWHNLKAEIKSTTIDFYVDDVFVESGNRPANVYGFDCVVLGSGYTANGQTAWIDNLRVEVVPEPATLGLVALGGLLLLRRRQA